MATQPFANMNAQPNDVLHVLLVKATYWAAALAVANGGTLPTAFYPNMNPQHNDSLQVLAAKLTYWLEAASTGSGGGGGLQEGAGAPVNGVTSSAKPFYWDTVGGHLWTYANGGWNA